MIARKMPNKDRSKSKVNHGTDIYNYINNLISTKPEEKILFSDTLNIESTEHNEIITEMIDLSEKSRAKNPFVHIVVSFHKEEIIDKETANNVVKQMLDDLGYTGCQCAYAYHRNTDNIHGHILINRVDKQELKCRNDFNDVQKIHKSIAKLTKKFGFISEDHDRYIVDDDGKLCEVKYIDNCNTVKIDDNAHLYEIHTGEKSMQRIAAEELPEILKTSESWYELHERLANVGFKYLKKGGGAILIGKQDEKDVQIKPSSLFREASLKYMQDRLGKYEAPLSTNSRPINRQSIPMDGVNKDLLNEHKKVKEEVKTKEQEMFEKLEEEKEKIKKDRQLMIDIASKDLSKESVEYKILCGAIKSHTQDQIDNITDKYKEKIEKHKHIYASATNFDAWLQLNKPEEYLKYIETIERIGNRIQITSLSNDHTSDNKVELFKEYHHAIQAERYRVTCRKDPKYNEDGEEVESRQVLILDKETKNSDSFGWTPEQIIKNIPKMTEFENRGEHIYFTPLSDNKHHFFIDDLNNENLDKLIHDGFNPSCIIQSSPNNFQAIYTLPKLGTDNDKNIINDIAAGMNIRYGDIGFCGAIHPHRAPGFYNTKPKYRKKDGTYPIVKLIDASGEQCELLRKYMIYMDNYYNYLNSKKIGRSTIKNSNEIPVRHLNNVDLYNIHHNDIVRLAKLTVIDYSRMDFMIAVRLRVTGHTMSEIEEVIRTGTPDRGKHNISNYAKLTAASAFSIKGDQMSDKYHAYAKIWRNLEEIVNNDNWYIIKKQQELDRQRKQQILNKESENENDNIINQSLK